MATKKVNLNNEGELQPEVVLDMLAKRVRLELDTTTVKRGKNKYYMFTQVPSRHPSNRKKRFNKGRGRNNRNKGRKPNNRGKKPQNKPSSENKE